MRTMTGLVALVALGAHAEDQKFELRGDAAKGAQTFKQICAACHGERGKGDGVAAPGLNPKPTSFTESAMAERLTPEYVYRLVKDGGPPHGKSPQMVAMGAALTDEQLRNVCAFALTLVPPPAVPPVKDGKSAKDTKGAKPSK